MIWPTYLKQLSCTMVSLKSMCTPKQYFINLSYTTVWEYNNIISFTGLIEAKKCIAMLPSENWSLGTRPAPIYGHVYYCYCDYCDYSFSGVSSLYDLSCSFIISDLDFFLPLLSLLPHKVREDLHQEQERLKTLKDNVHCVLRLWQELKKRWLLIFMTLCNEFIFYHTFIALIIHHTID